MRTLALALLLTVLGACGTGPPRASAPLPALFRVPEDASAEEPVSLAAPPSPLRAPVHLPGGWLADEEDVVPIDDDDEEPGDTGADGAAASNPLAAVTNVDLIWEEIEFNGGKEARDTWLKASKMLHERLKLNVEVHYVRTDLTGSNERDWESVSIKPIWFVEDFQVNDTWGARLAAGVEYVHDFDNLDKGVGLGTDLIAPLVGYAFANRESKTVLIPLVQHFQSVGPGTDVTQTAARFIALQPLDGGRWVKGDVRLPYDWENQEWPAELETEVGQMLSPVRGLFAQFKHGVGGHAVIDWAAAAGYRMRF